jgi:hypothetical protein
VGGGRVRGLPELRAQSRPCNSFIVIASSTEHTRKILNSPAYTEPCLVASAKKVLCHDNW